jgi:hypothetical protein
MPAAETIVGTFYPRQKIVAEPASGERGQNSIHHDDDAENKVGVLERVVALAVEELRHPDLNASERERHGGHAQGGDDECRVFS